MKEELEDLINNLPSYPNILNKEKYFNSAVLISLIKSGDNYQFLFQERANGIRQGGEICFPGGRYDPEQDKNYKDTAVRETIEELGINREKISIKGRLDTIVAALGATVDSFIGVLKINSLKELKIDRREVAEVFTIPVSYFKENPPDKYQVRLEVKPSYINKEGEEVILLPVEELGLPDRYKTPWGRRRDDIYVYKMGERVIWGITAQLISEVIDRWQH